MEFFLLQCALFVSTIAHFLVLFPCCTRSQELSFDTLFSGDNVIVGQDLPLVCTLPDVFNLRTDKLEIYFQSKLLILFENEQFKPQTTSTHYQTAHLTSAHSNANIVLLTVNKVSLNDTGQYQCIITSSTQEEYFSNILDISVLQIPTPNCSALNTHDAAFENNALTIKEGSEVSLQCQADLDVNSVPVILHWSRSDGETVSQSSYLVQALTSLSPSIDDDGIAYTCTATNSKYEGASHTCTINISVKKDFVNLNFTNADAGKSDAGLIAGVAVMVVILLVVLIVIASICLIRSVRKQRDRGDSTFQLSPRIEISRERHDIANDIVAREPLPDPIRSFRDQPPLPTLISQGNDSPVYDEPAGFEQFNKNKAFVLPQIPRQRQAVSDDTATTDVSPEPARSFPVAPSLIALIKQRNDNPVYDEPPQVDEPSSSPTPAGFGQFNKNKVFVLPQIPARITHSDESFPPYGIVDKTRDHDT